MSKIIVISRARSGSTAFMELLNCHPQIKDFGEILNRSNGILPDTGSNLCEIVSKKLTPSIESEFGKGKPAFKVLVDQITYLDLNMEYLMHRCGIETAIVVWRKNVVETIVSERIAATTGKWYSNQEAVKIESIEISEADLRAKMDQSEKAWIKCFESWPIEVRPIFVQYEEFFCDDSRGNAKNLDARMRQIFAQLGCADCEFAECYAKRQNPAPLYDKVTNWNDLPIDLRKTELDIPALFDYTISKRFGLPKSIVDNLVPDREPQVNVDGFHVRVSEPYLPPESIEYVNDALRTGSISSAGVWPERLALRLRNLFHAPVAIPCCNGFAALVLALQSAGIKPNDQVIVPALTMIAVPNAVKFVGADCVFVDNADDDYNPTWKQIEDVATTATKALIIAHTYGRPALEIEAIVEGCKRRNWVCIEDVSECVGIRMQTKDGARLLGTFGDYACASMYANKIVHGADGGFVIAKNAECGVRLTSITNHGFTKTFHFVHFEPSINGKMNGLGAAVACGVLDKLPHIMQHREMLSKRYRDGLAQLVTDGHLELMPECGVGDTPWVFGVHCKSKMARTQLRQYLANGGIETRDYFFPLHLQPAYRSADAVLQTLPNAERFGSTGFYLPTHSKLTEDTIEKIVTIICDFFSDVRLSATDLALKTKNAMVKAVELIPDAYGLQLLKQAKQCFNGEESFDEKSSIVDLINDYCRNTKAFTYVEQRLLGYRNYFVATMNIDKVNALSTSALEEILNARITGGEITTVVYICEDCRNGYKDIVGVSAADNGLQFYADDMSDEAKLTALVEVMKRERCFVVINIEKSDEDEAFVSKLDDFYTDFPTEALNHQLLLFGGNEELRFLLNLSKKFLLKGKTSTIRLYEAHVHTPLQQDWDITQKRWNRCFPKQLNFIGDPEWDHHHQNAFAFAVDQLKGKLHDENAPVLFISAVEQYICDASETPKKPWIGIVHGIPHCYDQFYVPDLHRLCTKARFRPWLRRCRGLLTLTSEQAHYLSEHLRPQYSFPIVQVWYPAVPPKVHLQSSLLTDFESGKLINVFCIGNFDRDFEHFCRSSFPRNTRKMLLGCESDIPIPGEVTLVDRLSADDYEKMLSSSIIFLSLKEGGAANTLVIECIMRNVPIVAPRVASVIDYIGSAYPLLYDKPITDFTELICADNVQLAVNYLKTMDKDHLSQDAFIKRIEQSTVLQYQPSTRKAKTVVDVTVIICSHRRTHHLSKILDSLLNRQKFSGTYEVIVWNNNIARQQTVAKIVQSFPVEAGKLNLISSTENYHCSVRFAMPQLMRSDKLLICDDDIIPGEDFIAFFARHHEKHPNDVLCLRGNYFLPHQLVDTNVHEIWTNYDRLRFVDDDAEERLIHYVHADACLIPKLALREVASVEPPDGDFMLIDDYWMSYVLNAQFGRDLRKLKANFDVVCRTDDSDEIGLAMHTRPDVAEARTRMYVHHMCNGWPNFSSTKVMTVDEELKQFKRSKWSTSRFGMNINSEITPAEMDMLRSIKVDFVRVGVVGSGRDEGYEFSELQANTEKTLHEMQTLIAELENRNIDVVLVLDRRLASAKNWSAIGKTFRNQKNMIGYDLCNEPFTELNNAQHWIEVKDSQNLVDSKDFVKQFTQLIHAVRSFDTATPIIIETPFWANIATLNQISINQLKTVDDNLIVSIHFYQPQLLTMQHRNAGRYSFPGEVPIYAICENSEQIHWTADRIDQEFNAVSQWIEETGVPIFVGEFGISRDVVGAELYLTAVAAACRKRNLSACLYAFRDPDWEAMDYELGTDGANQHRRSLEDENPLYRTIKDIIRS